MDVDLSAVPPVWVSPDLRAALTTGEAPSPESGQVWRVEFGGWSALVVIRHAERDHVVVSPVGDHGAEQMELWGHPATWEPDVRVRVRRHVLDTLLGAAAVSPDASLSGELSPRHPLAVVMDASTSDEPITEGLGAFLARHGVALQRVAEVLGLTGSAIVAFARDRYLPTDEEVGLLAEEARVSPDEIRQATPVVPRPLELALRRPSIRQRLQRLASQLRPSFEIRLEVARQALLTGQRTTGAGGEDWDQIVADVLSAMERPRDAD